MLHGCLDSYCDSFHIIRNIKGNNLTLNQDDGNEMLFISNTECITDTFLDCVNFLFL